MTIKIFIPYSEDKPISQKILDSINIEVIKINCSYDKKILKIKRIIMAEKFFKDIALKNIYDFYVYNQSDILHLQKDNFSIMQKFLTLNTNFGAVSLARRIISKNAFIEYNRNYNNHICSGCIMFTRLGLEAVKFDLDSAKRPTCFSIGKSLALADLKYGYVDNIMRVKHIH